LEGDDPTQEDEIDDPVVDVPGGGPTRGQLGELDVDPGLRVARQTGLHFIEEDLANM
jgi:hypothetical protein